MSTAIYTSESRSMDPARGLARGLGWFSIALGTAEVLAPGALARALGMEERERVIRAYGVREIVTGIGILSAKDPTPWVWARVAGDALDMATLGTSVPDNPRKGAVGVAFAAVAGVTALDILCGQKRSSAQAALAEPVHDYSDRSGFPRPPEEMRGVAARDFETPEDMRTPEAMRPYTQV
jgi:hypothetical protein